MSRKYRHRGYMDSDRDTEVRGKPPPKPKKPLTPEEKAQRRGLRHATQREANEVVRCPDCGTNVEAMGMITGETRCPRCSASLHCCRACRHFDPGARWECRAPIEEPVPAKTKSNDCALYEPRRVLDATGKRATSRASNDPKSAFENLFKR